MTVARLAIIILVVAAVAYLLHIGFFSFAFYALVMLVGASWLMSKSALNGIAHSRTANKTKARLGETVSVVTEVTNNKNLPVLWTLVEDLVPERLERDGSSGFAALLKPHEMRPLKFNLKCTQRGYHQIGPLVLESGDIFGLFRRFRAGSSAHFVTVYPRVVPISRYELSTRRPIGEVRVQQQIYEDPTRIAGIREYRPGDPLSRIHWKATARTGVLHSKVYEPSTMMGANIVLDFNRSAWAGDYAYERSELAIVVASSIAYYVTQQKQSAGLVSNGRDAAERAQWELQELQTTSRRELRRRLAERPGGDRLRPVQVLAGKAGANILELMEALARLELTDGLPLAQMILSQYTAWPRDAALLLIVPQVPSELVEVIVKLKVTGFVVVVFVIFNQEEFIRARARLSYEGVSVFHVQQERDLDVLARETI